MFYLFTEYTYKHFTRGRIVIAHAALTAFNHNAAVNCAAALQYYRIIGLYIKAGFDIVYPDHFTFVIGYVKPAVLLAEAAVGRKLDDTFLAVGALRALYIN